MAKRTGKKGRGQRRPAPKAGKPTGKLTLTGILTLLQKWTDGFDERLRTVSETTNLAYKSIEYATPTRLKTVADSIVDRVLGQNQSRANVPRTTVDATRSIFAPSTFADEVPLRGTPATQLPHIADAPTLAPLSNPFPALVAAEIAKARSKHGPQRNSHEAFGVITEEWNEYAETVFKNQPATRAIEELVQLAAMCQRAAEDVYGVPRA